MVGKGPSAEKRSRQTERYQMRSCPLRASCVYHSGLIGVTPWSLEIPTPPLCAPGGEMHGKIGGRWR